MTRGRETLLEVSHGSEKKDRWSATRKATGINPNDETANMSPSDAIVYRQLSGEKTITNDALGKILRPNADPKRADALVRESLVRLRRLLPNTTNKSVVNVGTPNHGEYLLVDVGEEQATIEQYARERAVKLAAALDSRAAIRASKTIVGQIEALLNLGGEVTTDVIFDAVFGGRRTQNNLTEISRAFRKIGQKAQEKGQTLVRSRVGKYTIYTKVNSRGAEKVKDELTKKGGMEA